MDIKQSPIIAKKTRNKNSSRNKQLINYEQIEGTPFTIITNNETKTHFIVIGNNRVSEETNNKEKLKELIHRRDYGLIFNMIAIITQKIFEDQIKKQTGTNN